MIYLVNNVKINEEKSETFKLEMETSGQKQEKLIILLCWASLVNGTSFASCAWVNLKILVRKYRIRNLFKGHTVVLNITNREGKSMLFMVMHSVLLNPNPRFWNSEKEGIIITSYLEMA